MVSKDDKKLAAEAIKNAMTSRPISNPQVKEETLSLEDQILLRMSRAIRDIKKPPHPSKNRERRVRRTPPRGSQQTKNYVTSVYVTLEEAKRAFIDVNPTVTTREVGPGDRYNDRNYTHGKETNSRNSNGNS